MFNSLVKIYDWYHKTIEPTCAPKDVDTNILCPIYYGKINIAGSSNTVEISVLPNGNIGTVRSFGIPKDNTDYGKRYILTPSCIQHRRNGSNKNDKEYQFFNKAKTVLETDKDTWVNQFQSWVDFHESNNLAGDITIIKHIIDIVSQNTFDDFSTLWSSEDLKIDDRTILVFTNNGRRIFDYNSDLYNSYKQWYEDWMKSIYSIEDGKSTLSGNTDLIIETEDNQPIALGIMYSNGRKMIFRPTGNATLDVDKVFVNKKNSKSFSVGIRDLWKIYTTFDYLCEQQHEWDLENRNIFFFSPTYATQASFESSLKLKDVLGTLNNYYEGFKYQFPKDQLEDIDIGYIYWTSSSNGRSSISEYQIMPAQKYVEAVSKMYEFFENSYKFCLYRIPCILETDSTFVKKAYHQMIHSVLLEQPLPQRFVNELVRKSVNPMKTGAKDQASRHPGYSKTAEYYYRNVLTITACLLQYNKYITGKISQEGNNMGLDRDNPDRSYLFGRLVAIYQRIEEIAMAGSSDRATNAEKTMSSMFNRPAASIQTLERKIAPYKNRLSNNNKGAKTYLDKELQETFALFNSGDLKDNTPLNSEFILGYYCQRNEFFKSKEKEDTLDESEENNND